MKLTPQEENQREYLELRQQESLIPMFQKDYERLKYLNNKEFHNCCSNVKCKGYEGSEADTICPRCGSKLFKLI